MPRTVKKDANLRPGKPLRPENLSARAAIEWDRLVSELDTAQIRVSTRHFFYVPCCRSRPQLRRILPKRGKRSKPEGAYITNKKTGVVQVHPASKTLNELRHDYIKVLVTLGFASHACAAHAKRPNARGISVRGLKKPRLRWPALAFCSFLR